MSDSKKKNKKVYPSAIIIGILVFAICTAAMSFYWKTGLSDGTIFQTDNGAKLTEDMNVIVVDENSPFYDAFTNSESVNILCLGISGNMSDTIMLVSYDTKNQKVDIVSVPRDTYYYRSGYGNAAYYKINSIYHSQGVTRVAEVVSEILYGMPVNFYAVVDFEGIVHIMDAIGGVYVDMPFAYKYDDNTKGMELHIDIPEGRQLIDGSNVEGFLRFRHTNPYYAKQGYKSYFSGDIQRIQVQQEFVKNVLGECLKMDNFSAVLEVCLQNIQSDITPNMSLRLANNARKGLSGENINLYTLPGTDQYISELSFWVRDEEGIYSMLETIYGLKESEEAADTRQR